jgi:hypothetical protein
MVSGSLFAVRRRELGAVEAVHTPNGWWSNVPPSFTPEPIQPLGREGVADPAAGVPQRGDRAPARPLRPRRIRAPRPGARSASGHLLRRPLRSR